MSKYGMLIANDYLRDCNFYLEVYGLYLYNNCDVMEESDYGKLLHFIFMAYECALKAIVVFYIENNRTYEEIKVIIKRKYRHDIAILKKTICADKNVPEFVKDLVNLIHIPDLPTHLALPDLRYNTNITEAIDDDQELFQKIIGNLDWQIECKNNIQKLKDEMVKTIHHCSSMPMFKLLLKIFREREKMNCAVSMPLF